MSRALLVLCLAVAVYGEGVLTDVAQTSELRSIKGSVPKQLAPALSEVHLNGGQYVAFVTPNGDFEFSSVPVGVYSLSVPSLAVIFSQYKVSIPASGGDPQVIEYIYPGAPKEAASYPIQLKPQAAPQYFKEREKFNILSFFKNPMMLMMLFSVFVMVVMPKMMGSMDPEAMKEFQEAQAKMGGGDPMSMLKKVLSGEDPNAPDEDEEEEDEDERSVRPVPKRKPARGKRQR